MRLFTSIRRGPRLVYLASTWNTPVENPRHFSVSTHIVSSCSTWSVGSREGALSPVSLNQGSMVGQLSVTLEYTALPLLITTSQSTSIPSRYSSSIIWHLRGCAPLGRTPPLSLILPMAPSLVRKVSSITASTSAYLLFSPSASFTRTTPMDSSPLIGFSTAGKPTAAAASSSWSLPSMRLFLGVGSPARPIRRRVSCLFFAASIALGVLVTQPSPSATRAASGTAVSQKVITPEGGRPSRGSFWTASTMAFTTSLRSALRSMGMNFLMMPSASSFSDQEPGLSMTMDMRPCCLARSKMNFLPAYPALMNTTTRSRSKLSRWACASGVAVDRNAMSSCSKSIGSLHRSGTSPPGGMMSGVTMRSYLATAATASWGVAPSHMICPSHVGRPSSALITSSPSLTSSLAYTTLGWSLTFASQSFPPITPDCMQLK
mmetsp:Transcript_14884/g.31965  ORF Transcript_14884/g.31965 Transcript_14884/m.31965 type:complete len:432 (-) Transcript_14884:116-1411(-)